MNTKEKLSREFKRLSNQLFGTKYPLNSTNTLEENVLLDKSVVLMSHIKIGYGTYLRRDVFVDDYTEIGRFCSIANDVVIAPSEHPLQNFSTHPISYDVENYPGKETKTIIGNDVWIGTRAIISKGVTVGDGAVIAANAVVTKNVPPYAVVAGVPTKIIKYRFEDDIIEKLLGLEWWNFPPEKLQNMKNIPIEEAVKKLEEIKASL
ncbi:MAG: CatB-related O-acetyltransferase [Candidatus Gastranaerophilaceae bacterium]